MAKGGLGKGLGALISTGEAAEERLIEIPISDIVPNPNQPRKHFNQQALEELVASIKEFGLIQPVVVRSKGTKYEIVAGERRLKAAEMTGLKTIPAIVRQSTDTESLEVALIENLQRENLNAIEEAQAYKQLVEEFKLTQTELADKVSKSRVAIANSIRLLALPESIKQLIIDGGISSGHARSLLSLPGEEQQIKLAERILIEGLTVRQTENIVRLWQMVGAPKPKKRALQPKAFKKLARAMTRALGAKVRIKMTPKKGKVEIDFRTVEDLGRVYERLTEKPLPPDVYAEEVDFEENTP